MKSPILHLGMVLKTSLVLLSIIVPVAACQKSQSRAKSVKALEVPKEEFGFTTSAADGRPVQFATYDLSVLNNVNKSLLHPKSQEFFGLVTPMDVTIANNANDIDILWKFTNIQESIPVVDVIAWVKRGCAEEFAGASLKQCLDEIVGRSGAVVFQPIVPRGLPSNLNDTNHILDVVYNTMGITPLKVELAGGGTRDAIALSCVSCHNSSRSMTGQDGSRRLMVDMRGDNAMADPTHSIANISSYITRAKNLIGNPADPIWATSPQSKASGLLAAQANRLREIHGSEFFATDADLISYSDKFDAQRAVNSGWIFAMMSAATAARPQCGTTQMACDALLADADVARKTERVFGNAFLPGGTRYNISREIYANGSLDKIPSRPMRSVLALDLTDLSLDTTQYSDKKNHSFALEYLSMEKVSGMVPTQIASRYLLGATSGYVLMPETIDLDLSKAWYGNMATSASAKQMVYAAVPRTVVRGFETDGPKYHAARYVLPNPVASNFAPQITGPEIAKAQEYLSATCFRCHSSVVPAADQILNCSTMLSSTCSVTASTFFMSSYPSYPSQTSGFAGRMFGQIGSVPEALSGIPGVTVNQNIFSRPSRLPLLGRQALTDAGYLSFEEALATPADGPQYAVVSPVVSINGKARVREMSLNFDLDGDGTIGNGAIKEKLRCNVDKVFTLSGVVTTCKEALKLVSNSTPRLLGSSDWNAIHSNVPRPSAYNVSSEVISRFLQALDVRRFRIPRSVNYMGIPLSSEIEVTFNYVVSDIFKDTSSSSGGTVTSGTTTTNSTTTTTTTMPTTMPTMTSGTTTTTITTMPTMIMP